MSAWHARPLTRSTHCIHEHTEQSLDRIPGVSGSFAHSARPEASGETAGHTSWTVIREAGILSIYAWIPQNELQEGGELGAGNFQNCRSYAQRPCSGSASRRLRVRVVLAAV